MNTDALQTGVPPDLPRAGFWRRCLATLIDSIIVMFPFQIVAAVLFAMTAGAVQMNGGFFSICAPVKTIPETLIPPPPRDSNFAQVCRISFFGATTGATLTVGRVTRESAQTTTVSQGYTLDKDGNPIHATSLDSIVWLAFVAYLVVLIWKTGRTPGARVAGTQVFDVANPGVTGVPLWKAIVRYPAMMIGAVPSFALLLYQSAVTDGSADAMFTAGFDEWFMYAAGFGCLWGAVLIVQIAKKTDPIYDRLAGTTVLRV